ncbi:MAG: hypothetical protein RL885_21530 [Planctomycetota bacterium]
MIDLAERSAATGEEKEVMQEVSWELAVFFALSGIAMALVSCLIGMRPKVENPAWWLVYAAWIAIVILTNAPAPFWTLWIASMLAGLLHGATSALLVDRYVQNNPWHQERMQGPRKKHQLQFLIAGPIVGVVFGALVGGIGYGLARWI